MEYRSQELLSQEGMEKSLIRFTKILREGTPGAFNTMVSPTFLRCNFKESTMVYDYTPEPWMQNPNGALHGGIVATMIDTTMGSMAYYMAGEKITPTIDMKINYVAPGLMHLPVHVGVNCTRCGRTMAYLTCKAWQAEEDKPFATADGVYFTAGSKAEFNL